MTELCMPTTHADCVHRILRTHLPSGIRVSAFGSRATGRGLEPHSDLDLLIDSPAGLPLVTIAELREAFAESDLPFAIDLPERCDASPEFLLRIENEGTVELNSLPAEHS